MVDRGDVQVVINLNDIYIYSHCPELVWWEYIVLLEQSIDIGIIINLAKCNFLKHKANILGYMVANG